MSRLGQAIKAETTGQRRFPRMKMQTVSITENFGKFDCVTPLERYRVGATFESCITVDRGVFPRAVENAKHRILAEVFGEFEGPLYEAEAALYDCDIERAQELIRSVLLHMRSDVPMPQ